MKPFSCSYQIDGRHYGVTIYARDWTDASHRLRAVGTTGQVDGETISTTSSALSVAVQFSIFYVAYLTLATAWGVWTGELSPLDSFFPIPLIILALFAHGRLKDD